MSKIFSLRDWLYLEEACKHLSERFNEPVSANDVLALALEGRISLSIRFEENISVRAANVMHEKPNLESAADYIVAHETKIFLVLSTFVKSLDGVFDLAMIGGERQYVRDYEWYGKLNPSDLQPAIYFDEIILKSAMGDYLVMVTSKDFKDLVNPYNSLKNYVFLYELPTTARLVVRTKAILALEASFQNNTIERPLNTRERTNLLNIIGALLEMHGTKEAGIIGDLLEKYPDKPGIKKRTLEEKFAEAKRSLNGT